MGSTAVRLDGGTEISFLNLDDQFGREDVARTINVRAELDAVFGDLPQRGQ